MTHHPTDFYIAHRSVDLGNGPVWCNITDGPCDYAELIEVRLPWDEQAPTLQNTRIWHFQDDVPTRDVTEDVIGAFYRQHPDVYCNDADHADLMQSSRLLALVAPFKVYEA